ncbi:hypothetical protein, partial [Noviherbaspirillum sp. Root189]|uniref:hypothetical protein n=1 Tax=Noviherbaspirillum sp. Root189 TaxID=1736487 RepID=UPI0007110C7E
YLHRCSGSFRREHFAGRGFHPLELHRLITAHTRNCLSAFPKAAVCLATAGKPRSIQQTKKALQRLFAASETNADI